MLLQTSECKGFNRPTREVWLTYKIGSRKCSVRGGVRVVFINKAMYCIGWKGWKYELLFLWTVFVGLHMKYFHGWERNIFQVLTRPTTCWHWPDRKRSAVSEEAPWYWDKRSWWSQLLLVGPGATEGRANLLNNPTSLSNSLALWSNVRILARNPGTLPTIDIRHYRVNILSPYPVGGGVGWGM